MYYDLICVTIWNIVFMISRMRIIIMDKNGCTVKLLLWKKTYKWEDLEIIREDCWNSGRLHLKGIVFQVGEWEKMEGLFN